MTNTTVATQVERNAETMQPCLQALADMMTKDFYKGGSTSDYAIEFEFGSKYIKIVKRWCGSSSVGGFIVNVHNDKKFPYGTLLKAASWAAPARNNVRGNIFEIADKKVAWTGIL
jgi:hypothetical protein